MKNNKMLVCKDCNSSDVSIKVWVNINETINNKSIVNYEDTEENAYCNSCESEQKSLNESTFSVERK